MNSVTDNAPYAVIAGLGATGLSCARYLHEHGWRIAVTDTRPSPPQLAALEALDARIPVRLGALDPELLEGAVFVVASPGLPVRGAFFDEAQRRGLAVVGDIELFARAAAAPVVGVTGTNGKSTVTTLVAGMALRAGLKVRAGGNLGPPALDLLAEGTELYVLELSSYQLETTSSLCCRAATVLNVSADHLDRYPSLASYAAAKARIFARCDTAVINLDDPLVVAMPRTASSTLSFSLRASVGATYALALHQGEWWLTRAGAPLLRATELRTRGAHNAANALAALAMCDALQLSREPCIAALREFGGLPHRSQWVADIRGVRYVDDSKGTNVGATLAAVAGMPGPLVLIAGGQGKGQDFAPLAQAFRGKVRHCVLIGQDAKLLATALQGVTTTQFAPDMDAAVQRAANAARSGETVLLSPACASLDMFRDYGHRGDVFAAAVRRLQS